MARIAVNLAVILSLLLLSHAQRLPDTAAAAAAAVHRHPQEDGDRAVAVPIPLEKEPRAVGSGISAVAAFRAPREDGDRTSIPLRLAEEHGAVGSDASRLVSQTLRGPRPCSHKGRHPNRAISLALLTPQDFPRNLPERLAGDGGFRGWIPREEPSKVFRRHEEEDVMGEKKKRKRRFGKHEDMGDDDEEEEEEEMKKENKRLRKHHRHHHRREGKEEGGIGRWFKKQKKSLKKKFRSFGQFLQEQF